MPDSTFRDLTIGVPDCSCGAKCQWVQKTGDSKQEIMWDCHRHVTITNGVETEKHPCLYKDYTQAERLAILETFARKAVPVLIRMARVTYPEKPHDCGWLPPELQEALGLDPLPEVMFNDFSGDER
jgi:hypothetical protein